MVTVTTARDLPSESLSPLAERVERVLAAYDYEVSAAIDAIDAAVPGIGGLFEPGTEPAELRAAIEHVLAADDHETRVDRDLAGETAILYVDGSSRGNPGPAGAGAVVQDEAGESLLRLARPVGSRTDNNTAEYAALVLGLARLLAQFEPARIEVRIDSRTVIRSVWEERADPGAQFREYRAAVVALLERAPDDDWRHLADSDPNPADALATVGADIAALGPGG
ncbi:ribonuclease HI family protein [Halomicrobium mukohataei]|uniref:ribonuclease HI family protein n=1 Tax=Halomicrobium mukohataei TaxID=57705 RepID=UPI00321666A0